MNTVKITILKERVTPAGVVKVALHKGNKEDFCLTVDNQVLVSSRSLERVLRQYRSETVKALVGF